MLQSIISNQIDTPTTKCLVFKTFLIAININDKTVSFIAFAFIFVLYPTISFEIEKKLRIIVFFNLNFNYFDNKINSNFFITSVMFDFFICVN